VPQHGQLLERVLVLLRAQWPQGFPADVADSTLDGVQGAAARVAAPPLDRRERSGRDSAAVSASVSGHSASSGRAAAT
jgi:hypothetical protein